MSAISNVSKALYPFESHFADLGGLKAHYVAEGEPSGDTLVMVHGNPTWSFYYRDLIKDLSRDHRVIAPDHIGCGKSDKPGDDRYAYTLSRRVDDLEAILDQAGATEDLTLVLHDWGGMIGMAFAVRHPARIKRLVLLNTAAFHLPRSRSFHWQLKLARDTRLGAFLVRRFNAFSWTAARVCVKRKPLSPEVKAGYLAPYDNWDNRIATLRFVQDIPLAAADPGFDLISEVQAALPSFNDRPVLICWGDKDFVFDHHFLVEWRRLLPSAEVHRFADCGHYVLEDATEEITALVRGFLKANPLEVSAS